MRWERLFADLEAQVAAEERAAFEGELADLVRAEVAALTLAHRLRAHGGARLRWSLADGAVLDAAVGEVGRDWVLLRRAGGDAVVPLAAVRGVTGLGRGAVSAEGRGLSLRLTTLLRGLARDRVPLFVRVLGGEVLSGTLDRVGADHVDLAIHPPDEPRRPGAVTSVRCVPVAAVARIDVPGGLDD